LGAVRLAELNMQRILRIGDLARATGVDTETIRYYEKLALLPGAERSANGYRAYSRMHVERLAFIRHCRALDMGLTDIRRLLDFLENPAADCGDIDHLIDAQLDRVRLRLASMQALEAQLGALRARCGEHRLAGECGILHELVAAAQGEACACHHPPVGADGEGEGTVSCS
jgi:Cd(II)/Pb(II)-responsive transcriptional regulator